MDTLSYKSKTYLVTVNYKSEKILLDFLSSINQLQPTGSQIQIIVVDSSGELNPSLISAASNHKIETIRLPFNQGFAYAANVGLHASLQYSKLSKTDANMWLLNPDTLVHPAALAELLKNSDRQTILGSVITDQGFSSNSTIWGAGGMVDANFNVDMQYHAKLLSEVPQTPFECDYIPGCSMFIPSQVLEKHGYLPEEFFLYFEETDWCLNLSSKGVNLKIIPKSLIQHISEPGKMETPYRVYFYNRNEVYFKFKNQTKTKEKAKLLANSICKIPKLLLLYAKEKDHDLKKTFLAHLFANFDVPRMVLNYATNRKMRENISLSRLKFLKNDVSR